MVNFDCFDIARPPNSFFWKLCLVTFNLRAIKKNRRGLQSHLEKEQENITVQKDSNGPPKKYSAI